MIITINEFKELGFTCSSQDEQLLEGCLKRAEYILNAMCGGVLASAMAQSKSNAALIKQAVAFKADALLKTELGEGGMTRVSLGDLSYSESEKNSDSASDVSRTVEKLLRAAGCFPCAATEVRE